MLRDQPRALFRIAARGCGCRLDDHLDIAGGGDCQHAETEPAAEIAIPRVALAALAAGRKFGREPDLVGGAGAIHRLQDQFQVEGKLQFADHHDRRIVAAQRHQIAAPDFALDGEAELFQEAFDGKIKRGFQNFAPAADMAATQCPDSSRIPAKRLIGRQRSGYSGLWDKAIRQLREPANRVFAGELAFAEFEASRACCKDYTNSVSPRSAGRAAA